MTKEHDVQHDMNIDLGTASQVTRGSEGMKPDSLTPRQPGSNGLSDD